MLLQTAGQYGAHEASERHRRGASLTGDGARRLPCAWLMNQSSPGGWAGVRVLFSAGQPRDGVRSTGIVDDLLQHLGLYLGIDRDTAGRDEAAAKILITALPGSVGVTVDYETFNPATKTASAATTNTRSWPAPTSARRSWSSGHAHADSVAVLHETSPGLLS